MVDVPENVENMLSRIAKRKAKAFGYTFFTTLLENDLQYLESPIEQILLANMTLLGEGFDISLEQACVFKSAWKRNFTKHMEQFNKTRTSRMNIAESIFFISYQVEISSYRTDFLISYAHGFDDRLERGWPLEGGHFERVAHVFVECDGHDFHEKTKEQAARDKKRDRIIQSTGIPILRYAGSEIVGDPIGCVNEINRNLTGRCGANKGSGFDAVCIEEMEE